MAQFDITIFTATYNRAHLLPKLYDSIKCQNLDGLEWLIIDDGSTDDTKQIVQKFVDEKLLNISYYKKENGGKHTAINFGVQKAAGELMVFVDSDDLLMKDALSVFRKEYEEIRSAENICGIAGLCAESSGSIIGTEFLKDHWQVSFADLYLKYKITGDKIVAFKTKILKQYPFPEPIEIRFVFEAVVWHEMAKKYDVIAVNKVLQIVDYQTSGVSDSSYKKWYLKALAFSFFKLIGNNTYPFLKYPRTFFWNYINLGINSKLAGENYFIKLNLKEKLIYLICYPRALYSYRNMKKKVINHD